MTTHRLIQRGIGGALLAYGLVVLPSAVAGVAGEATVDSRVRDAANNDVTGASLTPGTVVHDEAIVTRSAGTPSGVPDPTGSVNFTLYGNGSCSGFVFATDAGKPLAADGTATSASFTTPVAGGTFSYLVHYNGDVNYQQGDGPCEVFFGAANVVTMVTHIRDAANNDLTDGAVSAGTVIHDEVTVTRSAGTPSDVPDPSGLVDFTIYDNGTCNGTVVATEGGKPVVSGTVTSSPFTLPAAGGTFSYRSRFGVDPNYAPAEGPCEAITAQVGRITTDGECANVLAGTAPTLGLINYRDFGGRIAQSVTPGVFFFWTTIATTVPNQVVTVTQSNTSTNNAALFTVHQAWDRLYTGNCARSTSGILTGGGAGASFTVPTPGTYFIGLKYQTKSIAGTASPIPSDIIYDFTTSLGVLTGASVRLELAH